MKKTPTFISHITLLFVLCCSNTILAIGPTPPPPPGLEDPPPVNIDLYMIPMAMIGIIMAFFSLSKTPVLKAKK